MAFEAKQLNSKPEPQGAGGSLCYTHTTDNIATIRAANYFNHKDVRSFINDQELTAGNGVPIFIHAADKIGMSVLVMDAATGNVTVEADNDITGA